MTLADRILARRLRLNLSQSEAADRIGMGKQQWSDLERGRRDDPRLSTLRRVAQALHCTVGDLVD